MNKLGIYIHIPFCVKKCNYCAFLSFKMNDDLKRRYIDALKLEIKERADSKYLVDTIFFGGGTPSLLKPSEIAEILNEITGNFNISKDVEITMEANPDTLNEKNLKGYRNAGINRLSMGVQSLDESLLSVMGRIHNADDVYREYALAREAGFDNINLDIIFAVPASSLETTMDTLEKIIKLNPEHISYYSLQLEEGTSFFKDFKDGKLDEIPDDIDRDMYHRGSNLLQKNNYSRYEISNFSKKGYECKHNLKYWNMDEYLGLGLGSSSYIGGVRLKNTDDINEYINNKYISERHKNTRYDDISEAVFTGLRKAEGVSMKEILGSKEEFWEYYKDSKEEIDSFISEGYLLIKDDRLILTDKGIDISNKIMVCFV
ncbi:MAG: radical SAM family heme chaperone HemW [Peptostreptococcaceae bacterium]|nr:radical SAM family heme chaperone HemW [Peptostreptococcaceae bacterium]